MFGPSQKKKNAMLADAVAKADEPAVLAALEAGADIHAPMLVGGSSHTKVPPLFFAKAYLTSRQFMPVFKLLVSKGADINARNAEGATILHEIIDRYDSQRSIGMYEDILRYALKHGADVRIPDKSGTTVYDLVARRQHYGDGEWRKVFEVILRHDAETGQSHKDVLDYLRNRMYAGGAGFALVPAWGDTLQEIAKGTYWQELPAKEKEAFLSAAVRSRRVENVRHVIDGMGVDPNTVATSSGGLLGLALRHIAHETAVLLLDRGASVASAPSQKNDILCIAAGARNREEGGLSITMLRRLQAAAKEQGVSYDLDAALCAAAGAGQTGHIIRALVEDGANPDAVNEDGATPLVLAARGGHLGAVRALLQIADGGIEGVTLDVNAKTAKGMTACDWALAENHSEIFALLEPRKPGYVAPPPPPPPVDKNRFAVVNDNSIEVRERDLSMTFNFWTQQVIYKFPDSKGAPVICAFSAIDRQEAIDEAYETLKRLGGRPPEYKSRALDKKSVAKPD